MHRLELRKQKKSLLNLQPKNNAITKAYGSREQFLVTFNPDLQREVCSDVKLCLRGGAPSMAQINTTYGEKTATMWLVPQLYNLSEYCGCRDKLQGEPLKDCASVIAMDFYYLTVTEMMLFFHWFKSGRYGRFYGSVDPLVITTSLRSFVKERNQMIERYEQEQRELEEEEERRQHPPITYKEYLRLKATRENK